MTQKSVLVTGASAGGIGDALCREFQRKGLRVFASVRTPSKASELAKLPGVEIVILDTSSSASIKEAFEHVKTKTGGKLDYLVNNAGAGSTIPVLDASIAEAKRLYDVNVWGVVEMCQVFTPLLLAAKGTIVNVSSIGGLLNTPWISVYTSSKAALTIISETLRMELAPLGVKVITVMLGTVKTEFFANAPSVELPEGSLYAPAKEHLDKVASGKLQFNEHTPAGIATTLVKDVLGGATGKIWIGGSAGLVRGLSALHPSLVDRAVWKGIGGREFIKEPQA